MSTENQVISQLDIFASFLLVMNYNYLLVISMY